MQNWKARRGNESLYKTHSVTDKILVAVSKSPTSSTSFAVIGAITGWTADSSFFDAKSYCEKIFILHCSCSNLTNRSNKAFPKAGSLPSRIRWGLVNTDWMSAWILSASPALGAFVISCDCDCLRFSLCSDPESNWVWRRHCAVMRKPIACLKSNNEWF